MSDRHKLMLGVFLLLVGLAYGAYQWQVRATLLQEIQTLRTEVGTFTARSKSLEEDYQSIKVEVASAREVATQELSSVFPTNEDLTNLTRLFDDFAVKNNFDSNPFFVSSLTYGAEEFSEGGDYRYVPVSLNLTCSKKNLVKFLEFVESSGSLEGKTRLMSIEDLTINYPDEFGGIYEVQVEINAYYSQLL